MNSIELISITVRLFSKGSKLQKWPSYWKPGHHGRGHTTATCVQDPYEGSNGMTVHRKKNSQKKNWDFLEYKAQFLNLIELNWIELKLECLKKIRVKKMKICRMIHGKNQFTFINQKPQQWNWGNFYNYFLKNNFIE